jgi:hypothetical protein
VLCDGSRFVFAVRSAYLLKMEFKINDRKQNNVSVFRTEHTVCFDRFIIFLSVTVVCLNERQHTVEIKISSKDR